MLYSAEFLQSLCGPVISRVSSILFKLVFPNRRDADAPVYDYKVPRRAAAPSAIDEPEIHAPEEQKQYKSFLDDRKANIANEDQMYMLITHGYNKHRFVSTSFIYRNKLDKKKKSH